jgi:hypothetical protein
LSAYQDEEQQDKAFSYRNAGRFQSEAKKLSAMSCTTIPVEIATTKATAFSALNNESTYSIRLAASATQVPAIFQPNLGDKKSQRMPVTPSA